MNALCQGNHPDDGEADAQTDRLSMLADILHEQSEELLSSRVLRYAADQTSVDGQAGKSCSKLHFGADVSLCSEKGDSSKNIEEARRNADTKRDERDVRDAQEAMLLRDSATQIAQDQQEYIPSESRESECEWDSEREMN